MKQFVLVFVLTFGLLGSAAAQAVAPESGCKAATGHQLEHDFRWMGSGIMLAPARAIKPSNLKWELPVIAGAAFMVNVTDTPASRQIDNIHLEKAANRFSNAGQYGEWGLAAALYAVGCAKHRGFMRSAGLQALEAGASALAIDGLVKVASNRVRPDRLKSQGNFWGTGGRSFASGHAAVSFAIASVLAKHTDTKWKKIALYGLAGAVSFARFPAKKHFLSDIFVGSTIGYVTGTYLTDSPPMNQPIPAHP